MPLISYELSNRFKQLTFAEIGFLKLLAGLMPKGATWINIGAGHGTSALAVLEARPDMKITTVDNRMEHSSGSLMGEKNSLHDWVELGAFDYPKQILGDSAEVGRNWNDLANAVFIDADHSFDGCMGDWMSWRPRIAKGGIVMFHDYKSVYGPGVLATVEYVEKETDLIDCVDSLIAFRTRDNKIIGGRNA